MEKMALASASASASEMASLGESMRGKKHKILQNIMIFDPMQNHIYQGKTM
jgi:hypothetical protein